MKKSEIIETVKKIWKCEGTQRVIAWLESLSDDVTFEKIMKKAPVEWLCYWFEDVGNRKERVYFFFKNTTAPKQCQVFIDKRGKNEKWQKKF